MRDKGISPSYLTNALLKAKEFNMIQEDDDSESPEESFEAFLQQKGLKLYKLTKGSTVYNALADQIYDKEESSNQVEKDCLQYWQQNSSTFGPIPSILSKQDIPKLFSIAANVYGRKIIVYKIDRGIYIL